METPDPLPERISPVLAAVPGVAAIVLGGSRASGAAHPASDTDIGLYFSERAGLDVGALLEAVKGQVDDPSAASITEVGGWGPGIVGGGWLTVAGKKVELLHRPIERTEKVISDCRDGRISMDYQPGHPHGFCSAISNGRSRAMPPASRSSRRYRYRLVMRSVALGDASRRRLQSAPAPSLLDHPSTRDASHRGSG